MSELAIEKVLTKFDRAEQRAARRALKRMVSSGAIARRHLTAVATFKRNQRKPLRDLTVQELVEMGIVQIDNG